MKQSSRQYILKSCDKNDNARYTSRTFLRKETRKSATVGIGGK
jgi:hypothetical protein